MPLPNPNLNYNQYDQLHASDLNKMTANDDALAAGTGLNTSAVSSSKIADDAVIATKIDWASTGADGGIWWEELGRTTLGSAGDLISITSIPLRKYLKVIVGLIDTGGTINGAIQFNADSGSNYSRRYSVNGAADTTSTSQTSLIVHSATSASIHLATIEILNIATSEKVLTFTSVDSTAAGATNIPGRVFGVGKWANTTNQINRVDVINNGTGDFAIGSQVVVLGHN